MLRRRILSIIKLLHSRSKNIPSNSVTLANFDIIRSSLFNPAHFRSNEFQPEIWTPELEGAKSPKEDSHKHL